MQVKDRRDATRRGGSPEIVSRTGNETPQLGIHLGAKDAGLRGVNSRPIWRVWKKIGTARIPCHLSADFRT